MQLKKNIYLNYAKISSQYSYMYIPVSTNCPAPVCADEEIINKT